MGAPRTDSPSSNGVLQELRDHQADGWRVRERPEVPVPNNGTESSLRSYVPKRQLRGSTRSAAGRRCRDTFTRRKKTGRQRGISCWDSLQDRLLGRGQVGRPAAVLRERAAATAAVPVTAGPGGEKPGGHGQLTSSPAV